MFGDALAIAIEDAVNPDRTLLLGISDGNGPFWWSTPSSMTRRSGSSALAARPRARGDDMRKVRKQREPSKASLRDPGGRFRHRQGPAQSIRRSRRRRGDRPRPQGPAAEGHGNRSHRAQVDPVSGAGLERSSRCGPSRRDSRSTRRSAQRSSTGRGARRSRVHAGAPAPFWRHFLTGTGRKAPDEAGAGRNGEGSQPSVDAGKAACNRPLGVHRKLGSNPFSRSI